MHFVITIVVQALLLGSWVNALFQEGPYMEPNNKNYSYACPKLYEGVCTTDHRLDLNEYYVNTCDLCYDGCTHYFDGRYNCRECRPGRWGTWCQYSCIPCSECWPCKDLCTERNDTTACFNSECPDRCTVGYYGNELDACTQLCGDCRDKQCLRCISGYYMYVKNGKQICNVCPTGSISCRLDTFHNNTIQAISCGPGYYLHEQDGLIRCIRCPNECQNCRTYKFNNNTVQCTSCAHMHYSDYGNIGCRKCPLGYEECELNTFHNKIQCTRPAIGYYLNASNQDQMVECSKCPDHCISCKLANTTIKCTSCLTGYYLYTPQQETGQRCNKCPVPYCTSCIYNPAHRLSRWHTKMQCTSCEQGFYLYYKNDKNNKCAICPYGCRACRLVDVNDKKPNCTRCDDLFSFQNKDGMGVCVINPSILDGSAEQFILTLLATVMITVSIVAVVVAIFKARGVLRLIRRIVAKDTKGPERSIGRSKDNGEWLYLGENMYYNPKKVIGKGSKAVVYEGRYGQSMIKHIAVKSILCTDHKEAEEYNSEITKMYREIKMMETLTEHYRHPHIVDFVHSLIDQNTLYIAFELGKGTLVDYVKVSNEWRETLKCLDVNRGISEGLRYVHEKGIVHRDLKPANIFIVARSDNLKAVIGDFGTAKPTSAGSLYSLTGSMGSVGYIAPEVWTALTQDPSIILESQCNKKSDIFSAAILFYYTLSLGDHPFGNERTAQDGIQKRLIPSYDKIKTTRNFYAHQLLIESMLKPEPEERPTAAEVCSHPANWTAQQIMEYFKEKSDELKLLIKKDSSKETILEDPGLIPTGNWMNNLPVKTQAYLKVNKFSLKYYLENQTKVRGLLRAIRNVASHYDEYPSEVQSELGDYPEGHVDFWLEVCPRLLMHVIKVLKLFAGRKEGIGQFPGVPGTGHFFLMSGICREYGHIRYGQRTLPANSFPC